MRKSLYPATKIGDQHEVAAGISVPDPYRWLESSDDEALAWQAAQNRLTDHYFSEWPHFAALGRDVQKYDVEAIGVGTLPRFVKGEWFRAVQSDGGDPPHIVVSKTPFGAGRRIEVQLPADRSLPVHIEWFAPSPDGLVVAAGVCTDGSENNHIQLLRSDNRPSEWSAPAQKLMDDWSGGAAWLPDASGFHFQALVGDSKFEQGLFFHDLAGGTTRPAEIPLSSAQTSDYTIVTASRDGRYLAANHGLFAPKPVAVRDLSRGSGAWRPFVTEPAGSVAGFIHDGAYVALTDIGAPRGRVVSIPLDSRTPNDTDSWSELIAETDLVLRTVSLVRGHLYVTAFRDTYTVLRRYTLDGKAYEEIELPGRGAIAEPYFTLMKLRPAPHPDAYYFVFSSLVESWGVYCSTPAASRVEVVQPPRVRMDEAVVEDHWATSKDGARVPYHTLRLKSAPRAPAPALIYAYGAFNLALQPEYPGAALALVAAGGTYVHGHIRGGAELGLEWWHGGRMRNKQNCYRDLYAIAEDLLARKQTTQAQLGMMGQSNGGLMAGVAAAQRPDLWRVIISGVPISDMLAMARDPYGRYVVKSEWADPDKPEDVRFLLTFSPYHMVVDGTDYPSILIEAGATDPRCPAWQARKFAARLQAAVPAEAHPVLLRVEQNAGHGPATSKAALLRGHTEWLAFLMREVGMTPASARAS